MHPAPSRAVWRASSHSGANGDCVQVASRPPTLVAVRDSKNPGGPMLAFTADQWQTFTTGLKDYSARLAPRREFSPSKAAALGIVSWAKGVAC
jgi:uncharacterized protein DUF397